MRICVRGHFQSSHQPKPLRASRASRSAFAFGAAGFAALVIVAALSFGRSVALAQTAGAGNAQNGKMLFADKGCSGCHGSDARGMSPVESPTGGPRIAPPPLAFPAFVDFVRAPSGKMIPFSTQDISDSQLADVYAYLQSLAPGGGGAANGNGGRQTPAGVAGPPIDSMSDLMVSMVYPATNNILLSVYRGGPQNDTDWASVQRSAVLLAESGNVLLMRGPAGDQGDWAKDAKALVDAGAAAYKAARAKDTRALLAVDQPINASCVNCHKQYRFNNSSAPIAAPPHP
jgi:mono/diheme cytochrome c family protein